MKLDLGCGKNKREGFIGVDSRQFDGVDQVVNLVAPYVPKGYPEEPASIYGPRYAPWPWDDASVDEVHSSHLVEHLTWPERVHFFNELYRVLKPDATAFIITPHWSHACFYGDPTHQAPLSEWYAFYLNKAWRDVNAPHADYTCDFEFTFGGSWDAWLEARNEEFRAHAMNRYVNSWRDLCVTLTKRAPK